MKSQVDDPCPEVIPNQWELPQERQPLPAVYIMIQHAPFVNIPDLLIDCFPADCIRLFHYTGAGMVSGASFIMAVSIPDYLQYLI